MKVALRWPSGGYPLAINTLWGGFQMACDLHGIIRNESIPDASVPVPAPEVRAAPRLSNRRLEFELGAGFEGSCGFALVLALSQMMEHGLGPFGRADLDRKSVV